jgi:hypothetical protein
MGLPFSGYIYTHRSNVLRALPDVVIVAPLLHTEDKLLHWAGIIHIQALRYALCLLYGLSQSPKWRSTGLHTRIWKRHMLRIVGASGRQHSWDHNAEDVL